MGLKYQVTNIEEVDEQFRSLYAEENGVFTLVVEGVVSKDKHGEFRDTNNALKQQLEDLQTKLDVAEKGKSQALAVEKGEHQKVIDSLNAEIESLKADFGSQLTSRDERLSRYEEKEKAKLDSIIDNLPEKFKGQFDNLDVSQAIGIAENLAEELKQRKPFSPAPKTPTTPNIDKDLSDMTPREKLRYLSQQKGA
jgi:chromosome segregation ATPase